MIGIKRGRIKAAVLFAVAAVLFAVPGCGAKSPRQETEKKKVVATTTMLYDLVTVIGQDRIEAEGLMGPGIDPHGYQASAKDVITMQEADIVVYHGLHLEGKMGDIFAALAKRGGNVICAADGVAKEHLLEDVQQAGALDPHIWFDVSIWMEVAEHVAHSLEEMDPDNAAYYRANLESYLTELEALDCYIRTKTEELPPEKKILITAHDAFRYFGKAYGFEVRGLQGISTNAEAGTADVSHLAQYIAQNQVKGIFIESSVSPKKMEALQEAVLAKGFKVGLGGQLYADSLGDIQGEDDTYILTCKKNVDTIVEALK